MVIGRVRGHHPGHCGGMLENVTPKWKTSSGMVPVAASDVVQHSAQSLKVTTMARDELSITLSN